MSPGGTEWRIGVGTIVLRSPPPPNRTGGFPASGSPVDRVYREAGMSSQTWILGQESMRFGDTVRAFHWWSDCRLRQPASNESGSVGGCSSALPSRDRVLHLVQICLLRG